MPNRTVTSFALHPENRAKLRALAAQLGVKPNHAINLLIQNASIAEVKRCEPVVTLPMTDTRHLSQGA